MNGKNIEKILEKLSEENNGVLRTAEATSAGISKDHFYKYMKQKGFEKYAHGIYVSPDTLTDEKYLIQARFPKAVYSHDAALYLHDLAEYEPIPLKVTVPASYNSGGLVRKGIQVYYVRPEWYALGIMQMPSADGHMLKVYDLERTSCDIVRRYESMDISVFNYAAREYMNRSDKNLVKLGQYASKMHMEKKLRDKMGVLF